MACHVSLSKRALGSYKKTSLANKQPPGLINFTLPILSNPKPGGSARLRPGPALDRPAVALAQLSTASISFNIRHMECILYLILYIISTLYTWNLIHDMKKLLVRVTLG